jgi:endonuclease/exonuclease/phosphatase family metal-dependent hydrolase
MKRRLRVVTWNVGRVYTPTNNNRLDDADVPRVAKTLHELDPDVVLLQELVDEVQLRALLSQTRGLVGELASKCAYDRHCATLARRDLEPRFEQLALDPTGRGVVLTSVRVGDVRAAALGVHFDVFARERRREQASAVAALTDGRAEPLVVVGGDLNFDPAISVGAGDALDGGTWQLLTERFRDAGGEAGPTLLGLLRVDHLLVRGGGGLHTRVSPRRLLPLGDHDPLLCDIELARPVDAASATS